MTDGGRRWSEDGKPPFWTERGWIVSAVFLAGAVLLSGMVWIGGLGGDDSADLGGQAAAGPAKQPAPPCPTTSTVASAPAQPPAPTKPPADVSWRAVDVGYQVPVSASQGPLRIEGGVLRCFAHTPIGAVLAAHIIPVKLDGPDWQTVADLQVLPGQGREVLTARLDRVVNNNRRGGGNYAGYAVDAYTPEAATVQLLVHGAGSYMASRIELRWDDGDWKLAPSRVGVVFESIGTVASSRGFSVWRQ
ncbi:hypothetical protein ACFY2Q_17085 [Micromonospora sp. NPDC000316]|uniref:hypothetical protein n=1 Tax=unclassified Micromonospora TaxID=2617518 RepID=UPI0033D61783